MQIKNLALIASLFALGCGDKSDDERLDALVEGCESLNEAWNELADSCDGLDRTYIDCEEQRDLTEEHGCLDEAEAAMECLEGIGYETLPCDESSLRALENCTADGEAFNECTGEETL